MSLIQHHPRRFGAFRHVYPVISRRSGGLSLGVNLSPTALCNFACVYCQVLAETSGNTVADSLVSSSILETELRQLIDSVNDGTLFERTWLAPTPPEKRILRDIAFSGDGEPTLSPQFAKAVRLVAEIRKELCADPVKIVLITNASTLHLEPVRSSLDVMLKNNGEIWAKLDAGTPEFFRAVSRTNIPFETIHGNLVRFTQDFPVVVQTCFLALHGQGPSAGEIRCYAERLKALEKVLCVQVYTVARSTPEDWETPLDNYQLDGIAETVRQLTGLDVQTYYAQ